MKGCRRFFGIFFQKNVGVKFTQVSEGFSVKDVVEISLKAVAKRSACGGELFGGSCSWNGRLAVK